MRDAVHIFINGQLAGIPSIFIISILATYHRQNLKRVSKGLAGFNLKSVSKEGVLFKAPLILAIHVSDYIKCQTNSKIKQQLNSR